jgi:hypothetical protein
MSSTANPVTIVAPTTVTTAAPKSNGFVSFLKHFGADAKKVLEWLGSAQNQKIIIAGEQAGAAIATAIQPALAGPIAGGLAIAEQFTQEIFKAQAIGSAAVSSDPSATNGQKAAIAVSAVAPDAIAFAEKYGLAVPTGDKLLEANNAMVAFWNAFGISVPPAA